MELELSEIIIDEQIDLGSLELDVLKIQPTLIKKEIVDNGNYSASDDNADGYSEIDVNVYVPKVQENITKQYKQNGKYTIVADENYDAIKKVEVDVDIYIPKLGTKTITKNGTYNASDDGIDGYSEVEVATSGVDINDYFITDQVMKNRKSLQYYIKKVPNLNLQGIGNISSFFSGYSSLVEIGDISAGELTGAASLYFGCGSLKKVGTLSNTTNCTSLYGMFYGCNSIETVPSYNCQSCKDIGNMFLGCKKLKNVGGLIELGKAYETTQATNYSDYKLNLSNSTQLTHESLMNIINNLYDIASAGVQPQSVIFGSVNLAKLTDDEKAIVTNKGWSIS